MKKIILVLATIMLLTTLSGCFGNQSLTDGLTNESNTLRWVVTYESGEYRLHEVKSWVDASSDALGIVTKCCGNRIWTSYNAATLYSELPDYIPDHVVICGD